MKDGTKKILIVGLVVLVIVNLYAGYEAYLFFHDARIMREVQEDLSLGLQDKALAECENLHYWRTTLCSSLRVAVEVSNNYRVQLSACDGIVVKYDGPWWLPIREKYLNDLDERKRTCVTAIIARRGLS